MSVEPAPRLTGMRAFVFIWIGQVVSLLGTAMSRFALSLWAWDLTGSATALALVGLFSFAPGVLLSPVAGVLVDRLDRKLTMIVSDLAAGLSTIVIFFLHASGNLEIWHLYVAGAFAGAFESFQFPAYSAAVSTMLPKSQYARASGMLGLAESASGIFAPVIAGGLFAAIGLNGILLIDIVSFTFAVSLLFFVHIPSPTQTEEGRRSRSGGFWREVVYGFTYIFQRRGLLGLQMTFFMLNLTATMASILFSPMILSRTGNNEVILGVVSSFFGVGGVFGGLLMSTWGGPKRRVYGVLFGMLGASLLGEVLMGIGTHTLVWSVAAFFSSFFIPVMNGSNQAIWQAKVAPDVQGRVFSTRRLIAQITAPVAMLLAGPLADFVFEPAMMPDGVLAPIFGGLVGVGAGAGMGLMYVICGLLGVLIVVVAYSLPVIRDMEAQLPDYDQSVG